MRKLAIGIACTVTAGVLGTVMALAAGETTGTNVSCATATLPAHTIAVDGAGVHTIAGTSTTDCHTATYTIPTSTVTASTTSSTTTSTTTAAGIGSCPVRPPGSTATVGGRVYNLEGWDTFTKNAPVGSFAQSGSGISSGDSLPTVYTGDHGMGWTEYPDGWGANGVTPAYQPSTVQSVHDGVLDFNLHNDLGANPSPLPGGNRDQTYGAYSFCERVVPDAGSDLTDFKQAVLLWPQSDANGPSAESDYPEGNFGATPNPGQFSAFAHFGSGQQDAFPISAVALSFDQTQWHVYTQTWGPGFRSYYVDGTLVGTSTSQVWSGPERWQLQVQPLPGHTGGGGHGHVYVNWAWVGNPAGSTTTTTSTTSTTPTTSTTTSTTTGPPPTGPIQHVVVIVMENNGTGILGSMPYLSSLASTYGTANNYFAIGHFSADNYIAMTSGTTCCFDDSFQNLSSTPNIFGQLGSTAQTLSESGGGGYAGRHDPQTYYGLPSSSGRYTSGQATDLTGKKFTLVVPGLCDDMHDCGANIGDAWLQANVPKLQANPNTAIFITFDESSGGSQGLTTPPANQVPMIVVSPLTSHVTDGVQLNHYSLLRKIEDIFGLPHVGAAATAADMGTAFGF